MEDEFEVWFKERLKSMGTSITTSNKFEISNVYLLARLAWSEGQASALRIKEIEKVKPTIRSTIPTDAQMSESYQTR